MDTAPDQILQRLEELRRWQEEQQNALITKQIAQREMLNLEKHKLYEMFGISMNSTALNGEAASSVSEVKDDDDLDDGKEQLDDGSQMHPGLLAEIQRSEDSVGKVVVHPGIGPIDGKTLHHNHVNSESLNTIREEISDDKGAGNIENPVGRPFLKRGEGLKARFKVHPSELRLDNLPKYKFAGIHRRFSRKKRSDKEPDKPQVVEETQTFNHPPLEPVPWKHVLNEPKTVQNTRSNISVQDTPTRQLIREQQREIDELDLFEHLEVNMQSFAPTEYSQETSSIQPGYSMGDGSPAASAPGRVQFMSQVQINEATELSDSETVISADLNDMPTNQTSTPNTRTAFQAFKTQLFGSISLASQQTPNETTIVPDGNIPDPAIVFVQRQSEELKQKLIEVEREIELFRSQNLALTKLKQQLELDRVQLDVDRTEVEERLNDERCKMEVYLHDERMKLLSEKETIDRRAKELRAPNRKEREETIQLKAKVAALETELATKEQRHIAAQGRLRAQIRTMEKDLKDFSSEIKDMKKENKKLESENVKLRRQSNNNMLNEINKNLARLSVPLVTKTTPEESSKPVQKETSVRPGSKSMVTRPKSVEISSSSESDDDQPDPSSYFKSNSTVLPPPQSANKKSSPAASVPISPVGDTQQNSKREIINEDGSRDILYLNGNIKKVSKDAMLIRMLYFNKDVKETNIQEGTVKYYYAATNTWHTSYLDGLEILEFPK